MATWHRSVPTGDYPHNSGEPPAQGPTRMYLGFNGEPAFETYPDPHWARYYRAADVKHSLIERCPNACMPRGAMVLAVQDTPRCCSFCYAPVALALRKEDLDAARHPD